MWHVETLSPFNSLKLLHTALISISGKQLPVQAMKHSDSDTLSCKVWKSNPFCVINQISFPWMISLCPSHSFTVKWDDCGRQKMRQCRKQLAMNVLCWIKHTKKGSLYILHLLASKCTFFFSGWFHTKLQLSALQGNFTGNKSMGKTRNRKDLPQYFQGS